MQEVLEVLEDLGRALLKHHYLASGLCVRA